jgi:serine phosphatase RsbU (regulator of sigma subunit)
MDTITYLFGTGFPRGWRFALLALLVLAAGPAHAQECLSGNCEEGQGKLRYLDGSTYEGGFRQGKREGKGRWTALSGEWYEGGWHQDLRNGQGQWHRPNGERYSGSWKNNARYGEGRYVWQDSSFYLGEWYSDRRFGRGVMTYASGLIYDGSWEDGYYEGKGTMDWPSGYRFWGRWSRSIPQDGRLELPGGQIYSGQWVRKGMHGRDIVFEFQWQGVAVAQWAGPYIEDVRPQELRKMAATRGGEAPIDSLPPADATADRPKEATEAGGKEGTQKETAPKPARQPKAEAEAAPAPAAPDPLQQFIERYDGDFTMVMRELEAEKQVLSEKGLMIRDEMEQIASELEQENLNPEQKQQLEAYLHSLENALIATELALEDAIEMTSVVINRMRRTILDQSTELEEMAAEQERQRQRFRIFSLVLLLALAVTAIFFFLWRKMRQQHARIERQNAEIEAQREAIQRQHDDVIASMVYARRIQTALLPHHEAVYALLPHSFILLQPRDIISGDFYWHAHAHGKIFLAAVDCTGHGVPGALMSLVGNDLLGDIVVARGVHRPDEALAMLHARTIKALKQEQQHDSSQQEGMDIALCAIDLEKRQIEFSGAKCPLLLLRNGRLQEIKGGRFPIGSHRSGGFDMHTVPFGPGDTFYLFSDGYRDQFGGPQGKKLLKRGFYDLLLQVSQRPIGEQRQALRQYLLEWRGGEKQIDDVLVIGFQPAGPGA